MSRLRVIRSPWMLGAAAVLVLVTVLSVRGWVLAGPPVPPLVSGTVTDSQSTPLANVKVELYSQSSNFTTTVHTDALGAFVADALPMHVFDVTFQKTGYAGVATTCDLTGGGSAQANATLGDVTAITGTLSPATAGVSVVARDSNTGLAVAHATSDSLGDFAIEGIPEGTYDLVAYGWQAGQATSVSSNHYVASATSTSVGTISISTAGTGSVSGVATFDYTVGPAASGQDDEVGKNVLVKIASGGVVYGYARTGPGGYYSIPRVPAGTAYTVCTDRLYYAAPISATDGGDSSLGLLPATYESVTVSSGNTTTQDVYLTWSGAIAVDVRDEAGAVLEGATIELADSSQEEVSAGHVTFASPWYIVGAPLAAGTYDVVVIKDGYLDGVEEVSVVSGSRVIVNVVMEEE